MSKQEVINKINNLINKRVRLTARWMQGTISNERHMQGKVYYNREIMKLRTYNWNYSL